MAQISISGLDAAELDADELELDEDTGRSFDWLSSGLRGN